jgi:hypothetical protein
MKFGDWQRNSKWPKLPASKLIQPFDNLYSIATITNAKVVAAAIA